MNDNDIYDINTESFEQYKAMINESLRTIDWMEQLHLEWLQQAKDHKSDKEVIITLNKKIKQLRDKRLKLELALENREKVLSNGGY